MFEPLFNYLKIFQKITAQEKEIISQTIVVKGIF